MTVHTETTAVLAVVHATSGRAPAFAALSAGEREMAALIAAGHTHAEITCALVIAIGTVKDHVRSILEKPGLRMRAAVAAAWHGHAPSA
jgi:DNA-binding NarL/FixJ family response regulator